MINKIWSIIKGNFNNLIGKTNKKRLDICNNCENLEQIMKIKICGKCGCPIKSKIVSNDKCPIGKW